MIKERSANSRLSQRLHHPFGIWVSLGDTLPFPDEQHPALFLSPWKSFNYFTISVRGNLIIPKKTGEERKERKKWRVLLKALLDGHRLWAGERLETRE